MKDLVPWAADNGCYAAGERFCDERYLFWLIGLRRFAGTCLFATAPDVLGDAKATWERGRNWLGAIRTLGFKAALVAQDGFDLGATDWSSFDVLFIGGTDSFKLGRDIEAVIVMAKVHEKWVHVGRVNSRKRFRYFERLGVDSVDGTFVKFGPDVNLPQVIEWVGVRKNEKE